MASKNDPDEISRMLHYVPQIASIFDVKEKVGEGTFSKVFRATVKDDESGRDFALKYLIPTSKPSRIASELQCLKEVGGTNNIVGVEFCFMNEGHVVIVMPYFPHHRFVDYIKFLTADDIRNYMRNLFVALSKIHDHGIIHRDVKPNNFLYDQYQKTYTLVDFGLAQRVSELQLPVTPNLCIRQPLSDLAGKLNKSAPVPSDLKLAKGNPERFLKRPFQRAPMILSKHSKEKEYPFKKKFLTKDSPFNRAQAAFSNIPTPPMTPSNIRHQMKPEKMTANSSKTAKARECLCFRKPTVCKVCLNRALEEAPRGGTPGFRAPEVLLKYHSQTTAIDMWSAGVILLSILSKKYPFFRAEDDLTALAEIIFLVGMQEMKTASLSLGKSLTVCLPQDIEDVTAIRAKLCPTRYLLALCTMIQQEQVCSQHQSSKNLPTSSLTHCTNCFSLSRTIPESAYDLLNRLLDPNPHSRITAKDALSHPFINGL